MTDQTGSANRLPLIIIKGGVGGGFFSIVYFEWVFSPLCFFKGECGLGFKLIVSFTKPLSSEARNLSRLGCVTESDHDCVSTNSDNMAELTMVMVIKMMMMTLLLKIHSCE